MPSVRIVSSRLTIQMRKYWAPVPRNSNGMLRVAAGAAAAIEASFICPPRNSGDCGALHLLRLRDSVALRVVDAEAAQDLDDLCILRPLGDGLLAGQVPDLVDRADHLAVDRVVQHAFHEAAGDLQEVDGEILEIAERRE